MSDGARTTALPSCHRSRALPVQRRASVRVFPALIASIIVVFMSSLAAFGLAANRQLTDSHYSMLLSEELYVHHDFYLDAYFKPPLNPATYPGIASGEYPYMIERDHGHLYYFYPPGSSILSVPFVAALNYFGLSAIGPDQQYNASGEVAIEGRIAAVLMAVFTACVFATAFLLTSSLGWSYILAFGTALGTQIWSTASRVLWSHTWGVLLLGIAILYLVGAEQRRWRVNPVVLATLMAWTFFVRPTNAIAYVVVSIYVVLRLRRIVVRYVATSLLWMSALVLYSEHYFGEILPAEYRQPGVFEVGVADQLRALAGLLASPSRGLLIFCPVLLVVFFWLIRHRRFLPVPYLVLVAVSVCVLQLVLLSSWQMWWGGFAYGPRLLTDIVPWLALLGMGAVVAWRRAGSSGRAGQGRARRLELVIAGVLLGLSVWINWRGASFFATAWWNLNPVSLDVAPERVWDWSDPQFLATRLPNG